MLFRRSRVRAIVSGAGTTAVVGLFAATALYPLTDPRLPPTPVVGEQFWELPTGSRLAYVRIAAEGQTRPMPIIFLHGGPGVPDMKGDADFFGRLAQDGFDVYVYDQVGRGRSSRLDDPRGYTLERDVADLEAIRRQIGALRVVLIGKWWTHGATGGEQQRSPPVAFLLWVERGIRKKVTQPWPGRPAADAAVTTPAAAR